ncbi:hypothetical protein Q8F55_005818 [Vanrija albida]|uniref:WW domain-containing protein n=1 Tax=Vanrija albida TaxID=181172 RepID=A0ABR3Q2P9_9TREE
MSAPPEPPLSPPWIRQWDPTHQAPYYVDPTTSPPTTQWEHPADTAKAKASVIGTAVAEQMWGAPMGPWKPGPGTGVPATPPSTAVGATFPGGSTSPKPTTGVLGVTPPPGGPSPPGYSPPNFAVPPGAPPASAQDVAPKPGGLGTLGSVAAGGAAAAGVLLLGQLFNKKDDKKHDRPSSHSPPPGHYPQPGYGSPQQYGPGPGFGGGPGQFGGPPPGSFGPGGGYGGNTAGGGYGGNPQQGGYGGGGMAYGGGGQYFGGGYGGNRY